MRHLQGVSDHACRENAGIERQSFCQFQTELIVVAIEQPGAAAKRTGETPCWTPAACTATTT
jgi:hypothetical protein